MIDLKKVYLILGALLIVITGYLLWRGHERSLGAVQAQNAALLHENAAFKDSLAHDETALQKHDTVLVYQRVSRTDTVLQHLITTATVEKHDTVWVPKTVLVDAKATLDSTKRVADACCQLARDYKASWLRSDSVNKVLFREIPSSAKPWLDRAEGFATCGLVAWLSRK